MKPKQRNKQKDILFILISSFIVVVAWIGFNLYHIWVTSTISDIVQAQLTPIDPRFDPQVIQQLTTRENVNPLFKNQTASPSAAPTVVPLKIPTPTSPPLVSGTPSQAISGAPQPTISNSPINRLGQ